MHEVILLTQTLIAMDYLLLRVWRDLNILGIIHYPSKSFTWNEYLINSWATDKMLDNYSEIVHSYRHEKQGGSSVRLWHITAHTEEDKQLSNRITATLR